MNSLPVLRVARPTDQLQRMVRMYREGLGLRVLSEFKDHQGFDGVILGRPHQGYHLEFTHKQGHPAGTAPTQDELLVFYIPESDQWQERVRAMTAAGFRETPAFNPFWDVQGKTFVDADGFRIVLQNSEWTR